MEVFSMKSTKLFSILLFLLIAIPIAYAAEESC